MAESQPLVTYKNDAKSRCRLSSLGRIQAIAEDGLPFPLLKNELQGIDLTIEDLERAEIVPKTQFSNMDDKQIVPPEDLQILFRLIRVIRRAHATIGRTDTVIHWLKRPFDGLDGMTGIDLLTSEEGGALIIERLDAIDHGMNA